MAVPGSEAAAATDASAPAPDAAAVAAKKTKPKYEKLKKRPQGQTAAGGAQEADTATGQAAEELEQALPEGQTEASSDAQPKDGGVVDSWDQLSAGNVLVSPMS